MVNYRSNTGTTRGALAAARKNLSRLGNLIQVRGEVKGPNNTVVVEGENGKARFGGFCWGYGGTGPHGLKELLTLCGVSLTVAEATAFKTPMEQSWSLRCEPSLM